MSKIEETEFNFEDAVTDVMNGKSISGKDGILAPLVKQIVEAALQAELESHISQEIFSGKKNRKNGTSSKTIKSSDGEFKLDTPRDRAGTFEPQLVKSNQTHLTDDIEQKVLSMYALGLSYRDICKHIKDMYKIELSTGTISNITDKIIDKVKAWQERPLESIYTFMWLDAIHYKIKDAGRYETKAVYTVLGMGIDGKKDVLGLYIGESEGANFWLGVLTKLQNRGVKDILIASVDGLTGFAEAIKSIFPKTEVQLCIVHQIRNSLKYVSSMDQKEFMKDLKLVYQATSKDIAEDKLLELDEKWGKKYPIVLNSWNNKWENLSHYFKYPYQIRKIMYTTNIIESVHRQFRKLTKTKGAFPNPNSLLKLLYLGILNAKEKWTQPVHNWSLTISQLAIFFEGRLDEYLEL